MGGGQSRRLLVLGLAACLQASFVAVAFVPTPKSTTTTRASSHSSSSSSSSIILPIRDGGDRLRQRGLLSIPSWSSKRKQLGEAPFPRASSALAAKRGGAMQTPPPPPPPPPSEWAQEFSFQSLKEKIRKQPFSRIAALLTLVSFVGYVFISPYAPGPLPDFTSWAVISEVGGLTLNYFCVLPTLLPQLAPKFSPVMEGVFNLILAWALLFSGFLVDGRKAGGSINVFAPFMAAMVALTNTGYLPYLVVRPYHDPSTPPPTLDDLSKVEQQLGEDKRFMALWGAAGAYAIYWTFLGRPSFGGLAERWASFVELASTDRLMFAFSVEMFLFWAFQGAMVDDDARRRGVDPKSLAPTLAKVVPFFGLVGYLLWRPPLPGTLKE